MCGDIEEKPMYYLSMTLDPWYKPRTATSHVNHNAKLQKCYDKSVETDLATDTPGFPCAVQTDHEPQQGQGQWKRDELRQQRHLGLLSCQIKVMYFCTPTIVVSWMETTVLMFYLLTKHK